MTTEDAARARALELLTAEIQRLWDERDRRRDGNPMSNTPAVPAETRPACPPHCSLSDTGDVALCPCSPGDCVTCDRLRAAPRTHPLVCACGKPWPTMYCTGDSTANPPGGPPRCDFLWKDGTPCANAGALAPLMGRVLCDPHLMEVSIDTAAPSVPARVTEGMTAHSRYDAHRLAHWVFSEARLCMGENERRGSHNPKCVELEGEMLFVLQRAFDAGRSSTDADLAACRAEAAAALEGQQVAEHERDDVARQEAEVERDLAACRERLATERAQAFQEARTFFRTAEGGHLSQVATNWVTAQLRNLERGGDSSGTTRDCPTCNGVGSFLREANEVREWGRPEGHFWKCDDCNGAGHVASRAVAGPTVKP